MKPSEYLKTLSAEIESKMNDFEFADFSDHDKELKAVDPATIAAIASTVIKIMKFINERTPSSTDSVVAELKDEIDHAIVLLNTIIKLLIDLRVYIREEFRNFVIYTLQTTLQIIVDSHESWKVSLINDNTRQQTIDTINLYYNKIQQDARMAFNYGYAHYDSLGFSYVCESYLAEMLNIPNSKKRNDAGRYRNYFELASNIAVEGSLAYTKKTLIEDITNLKNSTPTGTFHTDIFEREENMYILTYYCYLTINGDIVNGFTYSGEDKFISRRRSEPMDPHHGRPDKSVNYYDNNRVMMTRRYNQAHDILINDLLPKRKSIEVACLNCKEYLTKIQEFIDILPL